jgi:hypothetical protein
MKNHFLPFMAALPDGHPVTPVILDVGVGHVAPPSDQLARLLSAAVRRESPPFVR